MDDLEFALSFEIASLAEAAAESVRRPDHDTQSNISQPATFPEPEPLTREQRRFRVRLYRAKHEELVTIQVLFWIGRDRIRRPNLAALRRRASHEIKHAPAYLLASTLVAPSLRRAVEMLAPSV